jgi:prepilin-type N-terminal cleavage/methylation domain-containing protein
MVNNTESGRNCGRRGDRGRRAFTMVEIMFAVLILGVLLGLLIGSVKMVTRMSKGTVDRQTVSSARAAVTQFKQLFGIDMPLVRERDPASVQPTTVPQGTGPSRRNFVNVYVPTDSTYSYLAKLHGDDLANMNRVNNPFLDYRYSERSIPIYLVGQLDVDLLPGAPANPNNPVIDGVRGAGFYKPLADGSYAIPADVLHPPASGSGVTKRVAGKYEPLLAVNGTAPKLFIDPENPAASARADHAVVTDRNGIAIRYYRWASEPVANPAGTDLRKLHVPWIVGRLGIIASGPMAGPGDIPGYAPPLDRDLEKNPNLKGASFAIVAAGPDGFFGDEVNDTTAPAGSPRYDALDRLLAAAGLPANAAPEDIIKARVKAEADNIVEVGQ